MSNTLSPENRLTLRKIAVLWWPLAISLWLLSTEMPAATIALARLPEAELHLAAFGGVAFPCGLVFNAPVSMLMSTSLSLCRNTANYRRVLKYMVVLSVSLMLLNVVVVFTPLYDVIIGKIVNVPPEVAAPARYGMMILTPWTIAIAYRKFYQGMLIQFGFSKTVGVGTFLRITAICLTLVILSIPRSIPGVIVGSIAILVGVYVEAIFVGVLGRKAVKQYLPPPNPQEYKPVTATFFTRFYIPLALTGLLQQSISAISSTALSRMPKPIESLAVFGVLMGVWYLFRSVCMCYNEVVLSLLSRPNAFQVLKKFTWILMSCVIGILLLLVSTSLADLLLVKVFNLPVNLVSLARKGLWLLLPFPGMVALQSWFQGNILFTKKTQPISEAIGLAVAMMGGTLWLGVKYLQVPGLYVGLVATGAGMLIQTIWLGRRARTTFLKSSAAPVDQSGLY